MDRSKNIFSTKIFFFSVALVFYSSIFSAYIGTTILSYLVIIFLLLSNINKIRFSVFQLIVMMLLFIYFVIVINISHDYSAALKNFKFWHGLVFYLVFLSIYDLKKFYSLNFFRLVCLILFLEILMINFIDHNFLLNFIDIENYMHFNLYFRPVGFTGSASMSSVALIILFYITEKLNGRMKILDWILFLSVVLLSYSATGYIIFILYLVFRSSNLIKKLLLLEILNLSIKNILFFIIITMLIFALYKISTSLGNQIKVGTNLSLYTRLSSDYFLYIFNLKYEEYSHAFGIMIDPALNCGLMCRDTLADEISPKLVSQNSYLIQLFGYQIISNHPSTTGHNGLTVFITSMGLFGIVVYALLLLSYYRANSNMIYGIILIIIGSLHYPAAMSGAGQLLMASMLIINTNKIKI
tara:strand:- start:3 stop:1235 length:1233 start_codon:yes stop_codon:yes gene_type:complete